MASKKKSQDKNINTQSTQTPSDPMKNEATKNTQAKLPTTGSKKMSDTATAETTQQNTTKKSPVLLRGKFQQYTPASDEDYMSPAQLEHFKNILNDWKQELMHEVDRTVDHMKDESANLPDPADRATQEEEFNLELRTRDRERKLIKKIDKTLETIENDEYGFCEDCGIEIGLRRLEARPTATLCIDCKTLAEIKEKQYRN